MPFTKEKEEKITRKNEKPAEVQRIEKIGQLAATNAVRKSQD